jgi:hypothetical protein
MNYAKMATSTLSLLKKFGRTVTHRKITSGTYDPATSTSTPTQSDTVKRGAIFDYNLLSQGMQDNVKSLIQAGDRRLFLDATLPVPVIGDLMIIGADTWTIKNLKAIDPSGVVVLYDLMICK